MLVLHHLPPTGHQQVMELQELELHFVHHNPVDLSLEQTKNKQCQKKGRKGNWIQHILKVLPQHKEFLNSAIRKLTTVSIQGMHHTITQAKKKRKAIIKLRNKKIQTGELYI